MAAADEATAMLLKNIGFVRRVTIVPLRAATSAVCGPSPWRRVGAGSEISYRGALGYGASREKWIHSAGGTSDAACARIAFGSVGTTRGMSDSAAVIRQRATVIHASRNRLKITL